VKASASAGARRVSRYRLHRPFGLPVQGTLRRRPLRWARFAWQLTKAWHPATDLAGARSSKGVQPPLGEFIANSSSPGTIRGPRPRPHGRVGWTRSRS